jgi:hypothetical protein
MLDKWRGVEEGGKSLQDASQKLLDERVRPRALILIRRLSYAAEVIYGCAVLIGPIGGVARGYRHDLGILPGARTCDTLAQSSRRVIGPPNGLSLYGRARGHLYRVPQIPRTTDVLVFHPSYLTPHPRTAKLQRSRSISVTIPAVHDASHDTDQNVLRRVTPSAHAGRFTATLRTGLFQRRVRTLLSLIFLSS